jgi:hypothetical protein
VHSRLEGDLCTAQSGVFWEVISVYEDEMGLRMVGDVLTRRCPAFGKHNPAVFSSSVWAASWMVLPAARRLLPSIRVLDWPKPRAPWWGSTWGEWA